MPVPETDCLTQKAVLWTRLDTGSPSDYTNSGDTKVSAATEISVRWEETNEDSTDDMGNLVRINSLAVVDRDIAVGSILWLGKLADLPSPATKLREVVMFDKVPDLKGRHYRRIVKMKRYSDTLPATS